MKVVIWVRVTTGAASLARFAVCQIVGLAVRAGALLS